MVPLSQAYLLQRPRSLHPAAGIQPWRWPGSGSQALSRLRGPWGLSGCPLPDTGITWKPLRRGPEVKRGDGQQVQGEP